MASRGEIYRLMGRFDEALADFNQAIELWPEAAWISCRTRGKHHVRTAGRALTRRLAVGRHLPSWALVFPAVAA
jgi:tetratricopeptide (TPR) repeat protein